MVACGLMARSGWKEEPLGGEPDRWSLIVEESVALIVHPPREGREAERRWTHRRFQPTIRWRTLLPWRFPGLHRRPDAFPVSHPPSLPSLPPP